MHRLERRYLRGVNPDGATFSWMGQHCALRQPLLNGLFALESDSQWSQSGVHLCHLAAVVIGAVLG